MKLFNQCVSLAKKWRHFLIICALLCGVMVMAGWIYMDNIRAVTTNTTYAWVVDNAQAVSEPIAADGSFRQSFTTSDPVFGGGFVFTIYDEICYGTVTLSLEDENGQILANTSMLGIDLYDNTFQQIAFPNGVYPDGETTYTYVITFAPDEGSTSNLGVWVSEEAVEGIAPYTLNGQTAETCASFAIVTNYAGTFIIGAFFACAIFAAVALAVGYWLLFIRKAKLHWLFVYFALVLGFVYMMLIPPYVAPDEETHIHTAYAVSNTILGIENETWVSMRVSDAISFDTADTMDIFSYQTIAQELFGKCEDSTIIATDYTTVYTEPFYLYFASTIGITIARLFNFNYLTAIYFARVMNLLAYTAIVALAIVQMPRFKRILCTVALLPMPLMLASAVNYDAIVIATALLYTATILKTLQTQDKFSWKQLILVMALGLLLAPMKKLYVFLCLFCCILPLKKCPAFVQRHFWKAVVLCFILVLCAVPFICKVLFITPEYLKSMSALAITQVNPLNIDYTERYFWFAPYILTHIPGAIKMILRTVQENTGLYLVQMVGGKAGEYILLDLPIWTPLIGVLYGALFLCTVPVKDEGEPLLSLPQKFWSALLALVTVAGLFVVCLSWTSLRDSTIWGIQGRYFVPLLPMVLLIFQSKLMILQKNIERHLILILAISNVIAAASVFQQIMTFAHNT